MAGITTIETSASTLADKWAAMGTWSPLAALKRTGETHALVDGVLPSGSITVAAGNPGDFKTFIAMDLATCVASGRPWHGRETARAVVLYIAAEGGDDIHVRRAAADIAAGDTGPVCIVQMRPRLDEPQGLASLLALVEDVTYDGHGGAGFNEIQTYYRDSRGDKYLSPEERVIYESKSEDAADEYALHLSRPRFSDWDEAIAQVYEDMLMQVPGGVDPAMATNVFMVIDTYSQTSADDTKAVVSRYIKTLRDLQEKSAALGVTVTILLVDHLTKSGDAYMGSLAKLGDTDGMVLVERHGGSNAVTLKCVKMKTGTAFAPIHLDMAPITLDGFTDALGRPLASLCVVDGTLGQKIRSAAGTDRNTTAAVLLALLTNAGQCTERELRERYLAHPPNLQKKPESVDRAFKRAFARLTQDNIVVTDQDGVLTPAIVSANGDADS
jgi:hypothetical protein